MQTDVSRPLPTPTPDEEQPVEDEPIENRETTTISPARTVMEPVGTDVSRPLSSPTPEVEEDPVEEELVFDRETAMLSPTPTTTEPVGTDVSRPLPESLGEQEEDAIHRSLQTFDEEPLNDLEWLDVINSEKDMPDVQYVPDVADTPSLPEEVWDEEEPILQEDTPERDFEQDDDDAEHRVDEEETATKTSLETLMTSKTTKAINPGRQRSKIRHKGKNITGSFRS